MNMKIVGFIVAEFVFIGAGGCLLIERGENLFVVLREGK